MKLKKLLPISVLSTSVAAFAPVALSSCSRYQFIDVLNGYKPAADPILEHQFNNYEEVVQYYITLDKDILMQDYIWSLGEYVKENFEFPAPVFPFKFTEITKANICLENWWTQPYHDETIKDLFNSSFSVNLQISGKTEPRNDTPTNAYLPYSNAVLSMTLYVYKFPFTIINQKIQSSKSNKTDARWAIKPASTDILEKDSVWNISVSTSINYIYQVELEHSVTTKDTLTVYWHNTNLYEPVQQEDPSQLLAFSYDSLTYGSYYLQNCTLKV